MISAPTPVTISIIIIESWSVRIVSPKSYWPAESHVHAVETDERCSGSSPSMIAKPTIAATKAAIVVAVER